MNSDSFPEAFRLAVCGSCGCRAKVAILELPPYALFRCRLCYAVYVLPRPHSAEATALYDEAYFAGTGSRGYRPDENYLGDESRLGLFRERMTQVARYRSSTGMLVDVGCASGFGLRAAIEAGWKAVGVDVSEFAVGVARSRYSLDVLVGTLAEAAFPDASVDAVTMWDVLEHVLEPRKECEEANRILRLGGVLAISTPDADCPCPTEPDPAKTAFWAANPPEHLQYYNALSISRLLISAGFRVVSIQSFGPEDRRAGAMEIYAVKTGPGSQGGVRLGARGL